MKLSFIIILFCFTALFSSSSFSKKATVKPLYSQSGDEKQWCPLCGLSIKDNYKTSYITELQNGRKRQYDSIYCLVKDMQEYGLKKDSVKVIDFDTQRFIDATKAFYVFENKNILAFSSLKTNSKSFNFKQIIDFVKKDLKHHEQLLKKIKNKKIYPMGKKIFGKKCTKNIDLNNYIEINELKADIVKNKLCKSMREKYLQAVVTYLWDVKRYGFLDKIEDKIIVKSDEKCPVCGMFTYKYPRWVAQIFYTKDNYLSFDGVKDMMKFYFEPNRWGNYQMYSKDKISKMLVTDYYSQKAIDAKEAFYVFGSNVYGPMGNELIPFKNESDAKNFYFDHKGSKIIKFSDIMLDDVLNLD